MMKRARRAIDLSMVIDSVQFKEEEEKRKSEKNIHFIYIYIYIFPIVVQ